MIDKYELKELRSELCYLCGQKTNYGYIFCEHCKPKFGDSVYLSELNGTVFVGSIPIVKVLTSLIRRRKVIKWWMGTDALTLHRKPPGFSWLKIHLHQIKMRLLEPAISHHWIVSEVLIKDLEGSGFVRLNKLTKVVKPAKFQKVVTKVDHPGFNVLYYHPSNSQFKRWVYGADTFEQIRNRIQGVNYIIVDGSQDMGEIYPIVDFYLRPSRHDGNPEMIRECQRNNIPYYWSGDTGEIEIEKIIQLIEKCKQEKLK